jgi:hypothetical protein
MSLLLQHQSRNGKEMKNGGSLVPVFETTRIKVTDFRNSAEAKLFFLSNNFV